MKKSGIAHPAQRPGTLSDTGSTIHHQEMSTAAQKTQRTMSVPSDQTVNKLFHNPTARSDAMERHNRRLPLTVLD